jgi:hypothetical protein
VESLCKNGSLDCKTAALREIRKREARNTEHEGTALRCALASHHGGSGSSQSQVMWD